MAYHKDTSKLEKMLLTYNRQVKRKLYGMSLNNRFFRQYNLLLGQDFELTPFLVVFD